MASEPVASRMATTSRVLVFWALFWLVLAVLRFALALMEELAFWIHCLRAEKFGYPSVPVKVFDEDGIEFLGTEQLLRYDVYKGQPCPQDDLEEWDFLGEPPYYACHHYETGHH